MGTIAANILSKKTPQPKSVLTSRPLSGPGSGQAPLDLPSAIQNANPSPFGFNETDTNDLTPTTVSVFFPAGVLTIFDTKINFNGPVRRIFIASVGPDSDSYNCGVWLSVKPTGINPPPGATYTPDGTEPWIELRSTRDSTATFINGTIIEFRKPILQLYLSLSGSSFANDSFVMTLLKADDICNIIWRPEANTAG